MDALAFGSIVHVNEKGGRFGGTEEYVELVTSELASRGVRSHLVCGLIADEVSPEFDSVDVVDGIGSREVGSHTAAELVDVVGRLEPDVIYLHNLFDPAIVTALARMSGRGVLVWYVHDHYLTCLSELRWRRDYHGTCRERLGDCCLAAIEAGHCVLRYPERPVGVEELSTRQALSQTLGAVDAVVVVSRFMQSKLAEAEPGAAERIHWLPRPIRPLGPRRSRRRTVASDPAVVTFAGRITPEKGLAQLIDAMTRVRDHGPVELRIAGIVEHADYWEDCQTLLRHAVAVNPTLRVSWLGHLDYAATDELLRVSDIVAVPSQWPEPLGAVALEAMSAGAAVVASRIGGLDTWLTDGVNGVLVAPHDVSAWTDAIAALLRHPARAEQLGARGYLDVRGLTASNHLDALDGVIHGVLSDPPSSPRHRRRCGWR
jgi:glycosyltransferase involved in cell wall biosynthesis